MALDQQAPQGAQPQGGGASQLAADIHSKLMEFADLVNSKFPEEGQALTQLVSQFQQIVDGLGSAPGEQGPQAPGQVSPEAGAAKAQPVP
jgi:hypothetical protein